MLRTFIPEKIDEKTARNRIGRGGKIDFSGISSGEIALKLVRKVNVLTGAESTLTNTRSETDNTLGRMRRGGGIDFNRLDGDAAKNLVRCANNITARHVFNSKQMD